MIEALKKYVAVLWDLAAKLRRTGFVEWGLQLERIAGLIEMLHQTEEPRKWLVFDVKRLWKRDGQTR